MKWEAKDQGAQLLEASSCQQRDCRCHQDLALYCLGVFCACTPECGGSMCDACVPDACTVQIELGMCCQPIYGTLYCHSSPVLSGDRHTRDGCCLQTAMTCVHLRRGRVQAIDRMPQPVRRLMMKRFNAVPSRLRQAACHLHPAWHPQACKAIPGEQQASADHAVQPAADAAAEAKRPAPGIDCSCTKQPGTSSSKAARTRMGSGNDACLDTAPGPPKDGLQQQLQTGIAGAAHTTAGRPHTASSAASCNARKAQERGLRMQLLPK